MRSAKLFEQEGGGTRPRRDEQERRPRGRNADWFLHDDRDAEPKVAPSRRATSAAAPVGRLWEYQDLDGQTHGPFSSDKMRQWTAKGYFQSDLQVRQAGSSAGWSTLDQLMPLMSGGSTPKPHRQQVEDPRVSAFERLASGVASGDSSQVLQASRRGGGRKEGARSGSSSRDSGRGAGRDGGGGRGRRGGREGGRGGGGQVPARSEEHGASHEGQQRQRGGRSDAKARMAAPKLAQAKRLFTNKAALATDQPLWRYVDLSGNVQGPFTAANMTEWYSRGYLADDNLMLIGHDRQIAPPNLPPLKYYQPLGKLLEQGEHYTPMTTEDIKRDQSEATTSAAEGCENVNASVQTSGATEDGKHPAATASDDALVAAPHADTEVAPHGNAPSAGDPATGRTSAETGVDPAVSQASGGDHTTAAKDVAADARHADPATASEDGKDNGKDGGPEAALTQDVSQPSQDTPAQMAQALTTSGIAADPPAAAAAAATPLDQDANGTVPTPAESGKDLDAEPVAEVEAEATIVPDDPPELEADVQGNTPAQRDDASESMLAAAEPLDVANIAAAPAEAASGIEG